MKTLTLCFATITFLFTSAHSQETHSPKLAPIFNGKDLKGWKAPKDNIWWIVDSEGVLQLKSGPKQKGSTLWTEESYENFVISFDFKLGKGRVDTGIYLRNDKEQIQIGESGSLKRDMTGSPYIVKKGYPVEAEGVDELLKLTEWNSMKIEAIGKQYRVWLNGELVMEYVSESAIESGPIGIQLHGSREMTASYRNIKAAKISS